MRRFVSTLVIILLLALGYIVFNLYDFIKLKTIKIDDNFYVLTGGGGNSTIFLSSNGTMVVDTKFWPFSEWLAKKVRDLGGRPVTDIINTDFHKDHTHGNIAFPSATNIVAHPNTKEKLLTDDKDFWSESPNRDLLPNNLVEKSASIPFSDEIVSIYYFGRGHTSGGIAVYWPGRKILHTGDLFFNGYYPTIDPKGGGSVKEWVETLDRLLQLDAKKIIPGHGPIGTKTDLQHFRDYLNALYSQVDRLVQRKISFTEIVTTIDLKAYRDLDDILFFSSRDKNIKAVYDQVLNR